jgi:hypothetical protein
MVWGVWTIGRGNSINQIFGKKLAYYVNMFSIKALDRPTVHQFFNSKGGYLIQFLSK